ncbi:MAG: hypothetical protein RLZ33_2600 [Bacteroidota bacterium]|jgi:hypothetical protein
MKTFILFSTFLLSSLNAFCQQINYDIKINRISNQTTLSKSKENFLTIKGTGCEQFLISGSNVSIEQYYDGMKITPGSIGKTANIYVVGIQKGKRIALGTFQFTIVE